LRKAELIIRRDGHPDTVLELEDSETLIGRAPTANLQLADDSISREHAVILWEDDAFTVEDLQSTNGIRVNGKKLRSAPLAHGDEVQIGQTTLIFVLPS
jgi:pSer/pThr/pTyr-binding forkhead associated (FHA) protein